MTLSAMRGYRKVRLPEGPGPKPGAGFARGIRKPCAQAGHIYQT